MEYSFTAEYTIDSILAISKTAKKVKKRNSLKKIIRIPVAFLGLLAFGGIFFTSGIIKVINIMSVAIAIFLLFLENRFTAYAIYKAIPEKDRKAVFDFTESAYSVTTGTGTNTLYYENITGLFESEKYFVLQVENRYGQVFNKPENEPEMLNCFR